MKNTLYVTKKSRIPHVAIALLSGTITIIMLLSVFSVPAIAEDFFNPVVENRADPWVYKHTDGFYYYTATVPEYDRIELRRAATIQELGTTEPTVIWTKHDSGEMGAHIWAPEIHYINNTWYIYFAAGSTEDIWAIRIYIMENTSADPSEGTWEEKGKLQTALDDFALDATTFEHNGTRYLVWAEEGPDEGKDSNIYIAEMSNPWTLTGPQVMISTPEYDWEQKGYRVNEGPAVLKRNGKIFITYSASATDANYCMGLLTADGTSVLLDAASWTKSPEPVFQSSDVSSQYGPGHNSFTLSAGDTEDILIYHARNYKDIVGEPLDNPDRHTRAQVFTWNADGTPYFGIPVADGAVSTGYYKLIAYHSGKVFSVQDSSVENEANVEQWEDLDRADQVWHIEEDEPGYYKVINHQSHLALGVADGLSGNGINVHQCEYDGRDDQHFSVMPRANGSYVLLAKHSGKAIGVADASLDNGANIHQWDYLGGTEQQIILKKYTPKAVAPDEVWYPLNEGSGDIALDAYGANDGAIVGATWIDDGHEGTALQFNGIDQYVDGRKALLDTSADYSLSAWVNVADLSGWRTFISQDGVNISSFYFQKNGSSDTFTFGLRDFDSTTASGTEVNSLFIPTVNTWYHLVGIHDSINDQISLYVNGELQGTQPYRSGWSATGNTVIGRARWDGNAVDFFAGAMDNVRLYNRVLTETEILSLYHGYQSWTSSNYPTYFIRHTGVGSQARIDPDVDPVEARQWRMMPGLADPSGVSFESIEYPGYYLRHVDFELGLHQDDGSDLFAEGATFYQHSGWADASGVSFESYDSPGYYIRHYAYLLRVDPVGDDSSESEKQDSTFNATAEPATTSVMPTGTAEITIDLENTAVVMSEDLYGVFFEDINYAADGGLYAELVQNSSFEYCESDDTPASSELSDPLYAWSIVERSGSATVAVEDDAPLNDANTHYLTLTITQAGDVVGVMNSGFDGIVLNAGARYDMSLYAKRSKDFTDPLTVTLESADGQVYASAVIDGLTSQWQKFETALSPSQSDTDARLVITTLGSDTISLDMVSLFPRDTFKNRKNGMRKDLAQAIADLQPRFLRFPGGCLVHGHGLDNAYRWKDTIGDVAERKPNFNTWGYHQSYGLGFYEYFLFSEDINAKALPVIPVGVSCPHRGVENAPLDEMDSWIQDALDLVEFANGPVTSTWGRIRADMGHPKPFNLEYLGLGNEEGDTPEFRERFELVYDAVRTQYPDLTIIGTVGASASGVDFDALWSYNTALAIDMVDEHYYMTPDWFLTNLGRYDSYDRSAPAVFIGEYASKGDTLYNAVSEAAYLTGVERNADIVKLAAYAPLLRHVNHTQWTPDLIWFDKTSVMKTANYYVQQMYATNSGDVYLPSLVDYTPGGQEPETDSGAVGVATWSTQAEFDDVYVVNESNTVLFEDDFSGTNDNWDVIAGDFTVDDGVYQQTGNREPDWSVTTSAMDGPSIIYTLKARKTGGDEGFLIIFGYQDSENYYWWNLGGWGNTQHAIEKAVDGVKSIVASTSGSIETGVWYDITIAYSTSGTIRCYLNDELIHDVTLIRSELAVAASRELGTGDLIIKLVNSTQAAIATTININGGKIQANAGLALLTGNMTARNTMDAPDTVVPEYTSIDVGPVFDYEAPPISVQVMRIKTGTSCPPRHRPIRRHRFRNHRQAP